VAIGTAAVSIAESCARRCPPRCPRLLARSLSRSNLPPRLDPVVDLSEPVQFEVSQLTETARARGVSLVYDRPASLPRLMLDAAKTEQVVMNMIDNAIVHTPTGGAVTVGRREKGAAVEYTVKDTRIGVPRAVRIEAHARYKLLNCSSSTTITVARGLTVSIEFPDCYPRLTGLT